VFVVFLFTRADKVKSVDTLKFGLSNVVILSPAEAKLNAPFHLPLLVRAVDQFMIPIFLYKERSLTTPHTSHISFMLSKFIIKTIFLLYML
jgi:hypothetical protein